MYAQLSYYYTHRKYKLEYQKKYYKKNKETISRYYKNYYYNKKHFFSVSQLFLSLYYQLFVM